MKTLKSDFHKIVVTLSLGAFSVGFIPTSIAASFYDATAGLTITLNDVTDSGGNSVSAEDWGVMAEGLSSPYIEANPFGDGSASASTSNDITLGDFLFLNIGDSVSHTATSSASGTTNGGGFSQAETDLYFSNITNSSGQTLIFSFGYDITAIAEATGDLAEANAQVSWFGIDVPGVAAVARSDPFAGPPSFMDASKSDSFTIELGAGGFTQFQTEVWTIGSAFSTPAIVPVPAAVWLFGSGLLGLVGVARRKKA